MSDLQDVRCITTLGFTAESGFSSVPLLLDMQARTPRCSFITQLFRRKSELFGAEPRKTQTLGGREEKKSQGRVEINVNKWCHLRTRLREADGERGKGRMFFGLNVFGFQARNKGLRRPCLLFSVCFSCSSASLAIRDKSGKKALALGRRQEAWHLKTVSVSSVAVTRAFLLE